MNSLLLKTSTALRLGVGSVVTVMLYRLAIRAGLMQRLQPRGEPYECRPFAGSAETPCPSMPDSAAEAALSRAEALLEGQFEYFSSRWIHVGTPPDWFINPITGQRCDTPARHWSEIDDFSSGVGDIKTIWELSRFSWSMDFARAYRLTGDKRYLAGLNDWISSWTTANPFCAGPNWKCGQETGLRLLHLLTAAYLLGEHEGTSPDLVRFVNEHCRRIAKTLPYALAQNNNHGTSEAAALFVGGGWLARHTPRGSLHDDAVRWHARGRRWLENRLRKLVSNDGSFSQYSLVYHRLLVDTLNLVELWRRVLEAKQFSAEFSVRAGAALRWLYQFTDPLSGDAPNLGPNDGTLLFPMSAVGYRDFRPSLQLGAALFYGGAICPEGPWDEPLAWLGLDRRQLPALNWSRNSCQFKDGGYVLFVPKKDHLNTWGVLRYANFRFRPSHADCLHFDLWRGGVNLLRDAGSYSYNIEEPWASYFSDTCAHNTVEIDGRAQMPRISRFLRGAWLQMNNLDVLNTAGEGLSWSGGYIDYVGASHRRSVVYEDECWKITDQVERCSNAILRWRLAPGNWRLEKNRCVGDLAELVVECSEPIDRSEIVEGWESRYYWQKSPLPVWEVQAGAGRIQFSTRLRFR